MSCWYCLIGRWKRSPTMQGSELVGDTYYLRIQLYCKQNQNLWIQCFVPVWYDRKRQAIYQKFQYSINFCGYPFYLFEGQADPKKSSTRASRIWNDWYQLIKAQAGFVSRFHAKNTLKINVSRAAIFVWWQLWHLTHKLTAMFCSVALHAIAITQPINKSEQRLLKFLTSSAVSWSKDLLPQKLGCLCQSSNKYSTCVRLVSLGR